jgi:ceramide glucosyltransferase
VATLRAFGDALMMTRTRGAALPWRFAWVSPLKDVIMGGVWFYAMFSRSVEWRGTRLRLGPGSVLRADDGPLPMRVLRRVLG